MSGKRKEGRGRKSGKGRKKREGKEMMKWRKRRREWM